MKIFQKTLHFLLLLSIIFVLSNCAKEEDTIISEENKDEFVDSRATISCANNFLSGGWPAGSGYQNTSHTLDIACLANGTTVQMTVTALDVPNRFTIRRGSPNGTLVTTSNWMGYANYAGPWGSSINTQNVKTLTFTYTSGQPYYIQVETSAPSSMNDYWDVSLACTCPPPCVNDCGASISGNYGGVGYYMYPTRTLNFSCGVSSGCTIQVVVTSLDVPNRFTIRRGSPNGTLVTTSNWMGYANYAGPWGSSINTQNVKTLTFTYTSGQTYYLQVETSPPSSMNDYWQADIACICSPGG